MRTATGLTSYLLSLADLLWPLTHTHTHTRARTHRHLDMGHVDTITTEENFWRQSVLYKAETVRGDAGSGRVI